MNKAKKTPLTTEFCADKKTVKRRFQNILAKASLEKEYFATCFTFLLIIFAGTLVGCTVTDNQALEYVVSNTIDSESIKSEIAQTVTGNETVEDGENFPQLQSIVDGNIIFSINSSDEIIIYGFNLQSNEINILT